MDPEPSLELIWSFCRIVGAGSDFLLNSGPTFFPPSISIPVLIPCSTPMAVMEERDVTLGVRTKPGSCLSEFALDPRPGIPTMLVRIV